TRSLAPTGCPSTWRAPTTAGSSACWCSTHAGLKAPPPCGAGRFATLRRLHPTETKRMAGLTAHTPQPTSITVHQQSRVLEVGFADGQQFRIPFELMRVYSPSAEVQGHGPGQEILQTG